MVLLPFFAVSEVAGHGGKNQKTPLASRQQGFRSQVSIPTARSSVPTVLLRLWIEQRVDQTT